MTDLASRISSIIKLANGGDSKFFLVACDLADKLMVTNPTAVISLLANASPDFTGFLIEKLGSHYPSLRGVPLESKVSGKYELFDDARLQADSLLDDFLKEIRRTGGMANVVDALTNLPLLSPHLQEYEGHERAQAASTSLHRQLTVSPTMRCNLACPYCICKGSPAGPDLTLEDWRRVLSWAVACGVGSILLCGGEPTFHPQFPEFVKDLESRGLRYTFATNALFSAAVRNVLTPPGLTHLTVHLRENGASDLSAHHWSRFEANLAAVLEGGIPVVLRYNIYRPGQDFEHVVEMAKRHRVKNISFALAVQGTLGGNEYVSVDSTKDYINEVVRFVETCQGAGLSPSTAKPLPPCLFGEQLGYRLLEDGILRPRCNVEEDGFCRNVTVNPDLTAVPCFGMNSGRARSILDFGSWEEMQEFMRPHVEAPLWKPTYTQCEGCYLYASKLCQGFCLANKCDLKEGKA